MLIGLSGYARTGKNAAAKILEDYGFRSIAFADKVREALLVLNPIVGFGPNGVIRVSHAIEEYGWEGVKKTQLGGNVRGMLQGLGTDVGRNMFGENVWVDATFLGINQFDRNVVTDVRFENEVRAIYNRGGVVVRIERPGVGPANDHSSENELSTYPFEYTINNAGTLDNLRNSLVNLLDNLGD